MKTTWKHMSAALLIFAGTVEARALTNDSGRNPGVVKEVKTNTTAVQARGEMVFVNLLNLHGEPVTVKVYDQENRLLYRKNFKETPVVEKAFNFKDAYEGTYRVVVKDREAVYSAFVAISR